MFQMGSFAHQLLRGRSIVPQIRVLGAGIQLVETTQSIVPIEMPPQQFDRLIDIIGDRLDFGAHIGSYDREG